MIVQTSTGPVELTDGLPSWVQANLLADIAAGANVVPETQGVYVIAADGTPVYIDPNMPSWVIESLLSQHGGLAPDAPVIGVPPIPPPPPSPGGGPITGGAPVPPTALPPPGGSSHPGYSPPPPIPPTSSGALDGLRGMVEGILNEIKAGARKLWEDPKGSVDAIVDRLSATTRNVVDQLVPTVSELALGLTQRFADLADFIGGNLADVGDLAGAFGSGMYTAITEGLDGAWTWLRDALLHFLRALTRPMVEALSSLRVEMAEPLL